MPALAPDESSEMRLFSNDNGVVRNIMIMIRIDCGNWLLLVRQIAGVSGEGDRVAGMAT